MSTIQDYLSQIKNAIYGKDVRQAIHDGIQQCYYDGKAGATDLSARQRLDTAEPKITSLESRMSTAESDIDVLDARVDQIVAPSGEAPSAAEVSDARIGADGTTYTSLGGAIRGQVTDLKSTFYGGNRIFALSNEDLAVGYITSGGVLNSNSSYRYGYIDISKATSATIHASGISSGSMIVNVNGANKTYKRNLYNWVSEGDYSIASFQTGDEYLCISCLATDVDKIIVSAMIPEGTIDDIEDEIAVVEANVETKMPLAKMYGGYINRTLTDVVTGKYVNNVGSEVTSSAWCYGFVDISDAKIATVRQTGISDSTIINMVDEDKEYVTNNATWQTSDLTLDAIPYTVKYLCISCKQVDLPLISVDVEQIPVIDEIDHNTDDSVRYDSATAYIRTNTPDFIKGVHLDCGRKYFSVTNIKAILDAMYSAGLNTFQIYFSDDNGFRFGLDDMDIIVDGVTYDLGDALGDGVSPTDGSNKWLTESEMDEIIDYAHSKGIEVIPAFNMPSHMSAIRQVFPINSIVLRARYGLSGERGVKFMLAIIKKYADYFASKGSRYYNICCDETNAITDAEIEMFMSRACKQITECHLTPMVYNDNVCKNGYNSPYINTGAVVYGWVKRSGQAPYSRINDCGFRMINCAANNFLYWTLGLTVTTETLLNNIRNMNIFLMADGSIMKNIKGVVYHVWCDQADEDGADDGDNVTEQVIPCIEAFGEAVAKQVPNNTVPVNDTVQTFEDFESMKDGGGVILKSANGTKYKLTVSNDGAISVNAV